MLLFVLFFVILLLLLFLSPSVRTFIFDARFTNSGTPFLMLYALPFLDANLGHLHRVEPL